MGEELIKCPNCERSYKGDFNYCPYCGQKAKDDLTLGVLFHNTISNYFSVDGRFFKSFVPLMFKPGYLAKCFVGGKRLLYLHPAQFYLFISVVFFFLFSFVTKEQAEILDANFNNSIKLSNDTIPATKKNMVDSIAVNKFTQIQNDRGGELEDLAADLDSLNIEVPRNTSNIFGFDEGKVDSLLAINADKELIYRVMGMEEDAGFFKRSIYAQYLKFYQQPSVGSILKSFYDTIPIAMFILLPIFALILKLFFFRSGRFAHHLVFSFYFFSFLFTVFSIILIVNFLFEIPGWIEVVISLSTFIYLFLAVIRFYGQGIIKSFFKTATVTFIYLLFVIPIAAGLIGVFAFLSY